MPSTLTVKPSSVVPTVTSTTPGGCIPRCMWTDWFDVDYPTPDPNGGDFETYANIRAASRPLCEQPVGLQCRAETLPDVPLQQLGQVVLCKLEEGLVCRNRDQGGRFKMCLNYHVRVLCCDDYRHCPSTPVTNPVTSAGPSLGPTSPTVASHSTPSTAHTTATSQCQLSCHWTDWIDSDQPLPGRYGGDIETYYHITERGGQLCAAPDAIECEAVLFPGVPLEELGQVVQCSVDYGLICRNNRQQQGKMCYNYHVRVLCCDCASSPSTTAAPTQSSESTSTPMMPTTLTGRSTTSRGTTSTREPSTSPKETVPRLSSTTQATSSTGASTRASTLSPIPGTTSSLLSTTQGPSTATPTATVPPGTTPTSPILTSSPVTSEVRSTTCQPRCAWTDWLDQTYPMPGVSGGDFETYSNIRAAGRAFCEHPVGLQCRAETLPDVPLQELGQVVMCRLGEGLVCRNRDQGGRFKMCLNYQIRVLCCDDYRHCTGTPTPEGPPTSTSKGVPSPGTTGSRTTATTQPLRSPSGNTRTVPIPTIETGPSSPRTTVRAPTTQAPLTSLRTTGRPSVPSSSVSTHTPSTAALATSPVQTSLRVPSTIPTAGTTVSSNSGKPSSVSPTTTSVTSGACMPRCTWTDWFDVDYPTPDPNGGDFETYANIRAASRPLCEQPVGLQCRAETLPNVPLQQLGQVVLCKLEEGLVCRNRDQGGRFKMCLNYHVRVLCCDDYRHCPSTPVTNPVTSAGPSLGPTSPTVPSRSTPSTAHTTATSQCQLSCHWLDWIDSDQPLPGRYGGDIETYYHITERGGQLCAAPDAIECEAVLFPGVPLEELGQVVQCSVDYGLICRNNRQQQGKMCYNYHVRVLCCDCASSPSTTAAPTPSSESTGTPVMPTTLSGPSTTSRGTTSTREPTTSPKETVPRLSSTTQATSSTGASTRASTLSPIPGTTSSLLSTTQGPSTATPTATVPPGTTPTSPILTSSPVTSEVRPTTCQPRCAWTDWLDQTYPMPGVSGGDFETYSNIRAAGRAFCEHPVGLQCRAETLPDVPLQELGQVVMCRLGEGLVCRNRDQGGRFKMCLNYQIRVLCCDDYRHCTGTPTPEGPPTSTSKGVPSPGTTGSRTTATTQPLRSPSGNTRTVPIPTIETGPSSPRTTVRAPTTQAPLTSLRTTGRPSVPSPSVSTSAPSTAALATSPVQTSLRVPSTIPTTGTTVFSNSGKPSSVSPTTTSVTSGACTPRCTWTDWFDVDYPTPDPNGGDFETFSDLRSAGHDFCAEPQDIECRAEQMPELSLEDVGQVVQCNVNFGLVCRNREQGSQFKMCYNYHVRLLCCDCASSPSTTAAPTPSSESTGTPVMPTTLSGPSTTSRGTTSTREPTTSPKETVPRLSSTTQATSSTGASTRASTLSPIPGTTSSLLSTTQGPSTATPTATVPPGTTPTSPILTSSPVTSEVRPTTCQPRCAWTDWLDQTYPMPGVSGGDFETYSNIRAAGRAFCEHPVGLQCRAETLPDVPLQELGQVVMCRLGEGLVCRNRDQGGRFKMCLNYQIRVLCCDDYRHCTGTPTPEGPPTSTSKGVPSPGTTGSRTTATTQPLRSPSGNTRTVPIPTIETGPSSPRTTVRAPTTQAPLTSLRTTGRPSVPSPSVSTSAPSTAALATSPVQTSLRVPSTIPTTGTTVFSNSGKPSSVSPTTTSVTSGACTPRCTWTDWFDVDYPTPGPNGGDFETFSDLRAAGHDFCAEPQDIECRAEQMPELRLEDVGQVVQCDVNFGLVCRNRDQLGPVPYCHNYHVRLLCCERHCPSSVSPVLTTTRPTASPSPLIPTTPCLCRAYGKLFSPGDVVYNRTDGAGCHFYAICNQHCELDRFKGPCPTSSTVELQTSVSPTSVPQTSLAPGCNLTDPPRQVNESWTLENCTVARCEGENRIVLLEPVPVANITCGNGRLPVKVQSLLDPCQFHYECESCVGPDGRPKLPGERWVSNCQDCVCDEGSVSVQCGPVRCEAQAQPPECSRAGFVAVTRPLANNPCCEETLCVCNMTTCPESNLECGSGEELVRIQEAGSCCPTFRCWPKLCTYNGTVYGVGATFPAVVPCHTCTCLSVDNQDPTVRCGEDACDTTCPQGSEYSMAAGQCCGECVQTACLTPEGRLVQPNETWVNSLVDNCTEYHCQAENGVHVLIPRPVYCPDVSSCRGVLRKTGCCYSCEQADSCRVRVKRTVLRHQGCQALVNITFCEGYCPGVSKYSLEAQAMRRRCTCCQETRAHEEVVAMQCPNGTTVQHTYTHLDECRCAQACIPSPVAPDDSTSVLLS